MSNGFILRRVQPADVCSGGKHHKHFFQGQSLGSGTFSNLTVKLGQSDTNSLTSGQFYTGALSTVYSNSSASLAVAADGWLTITLDRPFAYNPALSLIVEVSQSQKTQGGFYVYQVNYSSPPYRRVWSVGRGPFDAYSGGDGALCDVGLNIGTGGNKQDYDGDGKSDLTVFDDMRGLWYINSLDNGVRAWGEQWGWAGAVPVPGDYDGDGRADMAVYDNVHGYWYIRTVSGTTLVWATKGGWAGALTVPER